MGSSRNRPARVRTALTCSLPDHTEDAAISRANLARRLVRAEEGAISLARWSMHDADTQPHAARRRIDRQRDGGPSSDRARHERAERGASDRAVGLLGKLHHRLGEHVDEWRDSLRDVTENPPTIRQLGRIVGWAVGKWSADIASLALVFFALGTTPRISPRCPGHLGRRGLPRHRDLAAHAGRRPRPSAATLRADGDALRWAFTTHGDPGVSVRSRYRLPTPTGALRWIKRVAGLLLPRHLRSKEPA